MNDPSSRPPRRDFLKCAAGAGLGLAMLAGCRQNPSAQSSRKLRVAFSNGGLQTSWCKLGHDTAHVWADLLGIDLVWFDGQLNPQEQRNKIDLLVNDDWDFCCFQALKSGILAEPVRQLKARNIPVIGLDTLLVEKDKLREVGVWMQVAGDHQKMAELSTQYLMDKLGGEGLVVHIGGDSAHSGAQARNRGFNAVKAKYPKVRVVGNGEVRWCDWKPELARNTFETLLQQTSEPIRGAFFHNDDMALACIPALAGTPHEKMVITAVDGQKEGCEGVRSGKIAATTVNPACMVHSWPLIIGQFLVRNGEKVDDLPLEIMLPTPLISLDSGNLDAMAFLSDPKHCMV